MYLPMPYPCLQARYHLFPARLRTLLAGLVANSRGSFMRASVHPSEALEWVRPHMDPVRTALATLASQTSSISQRQHRAPLALMRTPDKSGFRISCGTWCARRAVAFAAVSTAYPGEPEKKVPIRPKGSFGDSSKGPALVITSYD